MNQHDRRRKQEIGVAFLSEVIADVLREAQCGGSEGWLRVDQVRAHVGFDGGQGANRIVRGILDQMAGHEEVENKLEENGGVTTHYWRLK